MNPALDARFGPARFRLLATATMVCAFLIALPTAASAQEIDSGQGQYGSTIDLVAQGGDSPASPAADTGALPFTGLDVALLAAVAGALFLLGLVLRRYRQPQIDAR